MKTINFDEPIPFTTQSVRIQFLTLTLTWWIGFTLSIINQGKPGPGLIWIPLVFISSILGCILLYRHWLLLQHYGARIGPIEAVVYGWVPLYCLYWWFVAYVGLAVDNNRAMQEIDAKPRMSVGLAMAVCCLAVAAAILALFPPIPIAFITVPYMILGYGLACQQVVCIRTLLQPQPTPLTFTIEKPKPQPPIISSDLFQTQD